jgi:6-pyruvoyltetrahydropterin/6-carboxytetrahydropterin synthase
MISATRIYRFSASHRLHSPQLGEAENARLYGKCNNPFGHGHDYALEVTAAGRVDDATGLLFPVSKLDRLVGEKILQLFASRNMNLDVPQFAHLVPTTENVALVIAGLLQRHWKAYLGGHAAHLRRVHIQETDRNGFEVLLAAPERCVILKEEESESVTIHA